MLVTFTILPLVLMIPFVWNNNIFGVGNPFDILTNSYFETMSGFTTTGFTFVLNPDTLPLSLLFYRSLVEFIGGVGFIYILAAFLYPNDTLDDYCETFGFAKLGDNLRKVFLFVMLIYTIFVAVFTVIFYFTYSQNLIIASCTAIDILTGGYQPNVTAGIGIFHISILVLMLLGSLNFQFHYNLFHLKLRNLLTPEIKLYLEIIVASALIICFLAWVNPFESLFNVVSMASSTGIESPPFGIISTTLPAKILFILIGLAGGCTFSMAGGIRIARIRTLVNAVRKKNDKPTPEELKAAVFSVTGFFAVLIVLSLVFSTIGISVLDSFFEVGSALTTNGISMGATTVTMPIGYKWLIVIAMILGRVEIVAIFTAIKGLPILEGLKRLGRRLKKAVKTITRQSPFQHS
jgi:trk system potassium uptake protein